MRCSLGPIAQQSSSYVVALDQSFHLRTSAVHILPSYPRVYNKRLLSALLLLSIWFAVKARAQSTCVSGSGTCTDAFTSGGTIAPLSTYNSSWVKVQGTADAYTTGDNSIAISGSNYAYYSFTPSSADVSQITVAPSTTQSFYARQACVRLTSNGAYCVGFGSVSNGVYAGCYLAKGGQFIGNAGCGSLSATTSHSLALIATGTNSVALSVYVDGVQTGTVTDSAAPYTTGRPGLALLGDGNAANSQILNWQDYQGLTPAAVAALVSTSPYACISGSGTCFDNFMGQSSTLLPQYNSAWAKTVGTTDAVLSGARSVQVNGQAYAYYWYKQSTSDTSQITVTAANQQQASTRAACVRLQGNGNGYCAGFGAAVNGAYNGCYLAKGGQYLSSISCGTPSSAASHTLALVASGTLPLVLQVYVDGVPAKATADYLPLPASHPGIALLGDGSPADTNMSAWRDYRPIVTAAAPTLSPAAGTYNTVQTVAMNSSSANAVIHYTTDGSTPTALSPTYKAPVTVAASSMLRALAMVSGQATSPITTAAYQLNLPAASAPVFTVPSPYAGLSTSVGIVNTAGAGQVQYCVDTTNTCTPSTTYSSPLSFGTTEYIRARTVVLGYATSSISSWQGTWSTVHLTTTTCPTGTQYTAYVGCILTAAGGLPPYTYSWSTSNGDALTEGLTLNPQTGAITGTVYGQGNYWIYFTVTDGTNTTVSQIVGLPMKADNTLGGCSLFPADSIWHLNVANLPVDSSPAAPIPPVYQAANVHLVFGPNVDDGGIPFLRVPYNQTNVPVTTLEYQSYFTSAPIPSYAPVEGTQNALYGDRHVSILQTGGNGNHCKLWEMYHSIANGSNGWEEGSNAYWDLESYDMLPQDNGSTDAAGLPIAPLLYNYDEVAGNCAAGAECGVVKHAGRLTLNHTLSYHVWPATAQSGLGGCTGGYQDYNRLLSQSNPPTACSGSGAMGEIQRLKSTFATPAACVGHPQALVVITAMRNYGLMITDNGYTGGVVATADARWNSDDLSCLTAIPLSAFEPVNVSSKMIDINSSQVKP